MGTMGDAEAATAAGATDGVPAAGMNGTSAGVQQSGGVQGERWSDGGGRKGKVMRVEWLWESHSMFDAWLVAAAGQVGFTLITLPYALAQMGYGWGISVCVVYAILGTWTIYLLLWLYLEFKSRLLLQGELRPANYILQYYEVIGGLTGRFGRNFTYFFNTMTLVMSSIIQLISSASNLYYANSSLDKRQWQYIVGGVAFLAVLIPDFGHFRWGAFLGVATTMLTSIYLLVAALSFGQRPGMKHTGANDKVDFFTGVASVVGAYGGHGITIEVLESMKQPSSYKYINIAVTIYTLLVTLPSSISVYWSAGDLLLKQSNAFADLPRSGWQILAVASLVTHQAMGFIVVSHPVFLVCEKAMRVHTRRFFLRVLVRIPVVALMWFVALAVPFFGPINALVGSLGIAITMFLIPPAAFLYTYRTKSARKNSLVKPPWFLPTWPLLVLVNVLLILWTLVIGVGFGTWGSMTNVVRQVHTFGFFDSCFQCPPKP